MKKKTLDSVSASSARSSSLALLALLICLVSALLLAGCSSDSGSSSNSPGSQVEAEIGPDGGTVEVTDAASPLYGVKVVIPADALEETMTIKISQAGNAPSLSLPATAKLINPGIVLEPEGATFLEPVLVSLPFSADSVGDPLNLVVLTEDESGQISCALTYALDTPNGTLTATALHFSKLSLWEISWQDLLEFAPFGTPFSLDEDPLAANNNQTAGGACAGMSNLALWYYQEQKSSYGALRGRRSLSGELDLANDAQTALSGTLKVIPSGGGLYAPLFYLQNIVINLFGDNLSPGAGKPTLIYLTTPSGHFVLADSVLVNGMGNYSFGIYDPNFPTEVSQIAFSPDPPWTITPVNYPGTTIDGINPNPTKPTAMHTVLHAGEWNLYVTVTDYYFPIPIGDPEPWTEVWDFDVNPSAGEQAVRVVMDYDYPGVPTLTLNGAIQGQSLELNGQTFWMYMYEEGGEIYTETCYGALENFEVTFDDDLTCSGSGRNDSNGGLPHLPGAWYEFEFDGYRDLPWGTPPAPPGEQPAQMRMVASRLPLGSVSQ